MNPIVAEAARELIGGSVNDVLRKLGGSEAARWQHELGRFLSKQPCWTKERLDPPPAKIKELGTLLIPERIEPYIADDSFSYHDPEVPVSECDDAFWKVCRKIVEDPCKEHELRYVETEEMTWDNAVIAAMGGEENVTVSFSDIYAVAKLQGSNMEGPLKRKGGNIFYVLLDGLVHGIFVYWSVRVFSRAAYGWHFHDPYVAIDHHGISEGVRIFGKK
jgi:hypothetical protein